MSRQNRVAVFGMLQSRFFSSESVVALLAHSGARQIRGHEEHALKWLATPKRRDVASDDHLSAARSAKGEMCGSAALPLRDIRGEEE